MSQEAHWWDGFTDGLSEFSTDLLHGAGAYFSSLEAQANAERAASENATLNQQARIDAANQQAKESKDAARRQQLMLFGGGALVVLIALYIIFRK